MTARVLVELLTRRPVLPIILWAGLLVVGVWQCLGLRPSLEVRGLLPDNVLGDSDLVRTLKERFLASDRVLVVLEGARRDSLSPETAAALVTHVETELRAVDGVREVHGQLSTEQRAYWEKKLAHRLLLFLDAHQIGEVAARLTSESMSRSLARLREVRDADPLGIVSALGAAMGLFGPGSPVRFADGLMTDRNGQRYFILVAPEATTAGVEASVRFVDQVEAALARVRNAHPHEFGPGGLRLYAVGRAQAHAETYRSWRRDGMSGMGLSVLFVYAAFVICFRRPLAPVITLLPIAISITGALLVGRWLHGDVHMITMIFCVLIVGMGDDFGTHIAAHYWLPTSKRALEEPRALLEHAVRGTSRGIFFGAFTTIAAFLALAASSYEVIRQTGVVVAVGVGLLLVTAFTLLPAVLYVWPARRGAVDRRLRPAARHNWLVKLAGAQMSRRKRTLGLFCWGLTALAATWGVTQLRFEGHPRDVFIRGNESLETLETLTRAVGVSFYPLVAVSAGATPAEALERDDRFFRRMVAASRTSKIALVDSLSVYLPPARQQERARDAIGRHSALLDAAAFEQRYGAAIAAEKVPFDEYFHKTYPERVSRMLAVDGAGVTLESLRSDGLEEIISRHLVEIGDTWYAATYVYPERYSWSPGALDGFLELWSDLKQEPGAPEFLLGAPLRMAAHGAALRADTLRITFIALGAVAVLLCVAFRSASAVLRALSPVVLSAWLLAGFMGAAGIHVHAMTLAMLPILIGIGVDGSIHIVARFRRGETLTNIYAEAGPGLVLATVTTAASFASFLGAENAGIRDFGLCGTVGVLVCLLASLHMLPLLYPTAPGGDATDEARPSRPHGVAEESQPGR